LFIKLKTVSMTAYSILFKYEDRQKIDALIEFVKSLEFVQSVEAFNVSTFEKKKVEKIEHKDGYLSVEEICKIYPDEWVLLANPEIKDVEILGGTVILHDPEKRNMALRGKDLIKNYQSVTHYFTGETPKHRTIGLMRRIPTS
jgi:hypothetical protein